MTSVPKKLDNQECDQSVVRPTYVVLDANIILHYQRPDQIDWPSLCGASSTVFLVIYPLLLTEISKAKDLHPRKKIRDRAAERESWLRDRLRRCSDPVRRDVLLHRDTRPTRQVMADLELDQRVADNEIVAIAVSYDRLGHDVRVATADAGLEMTLQDRSISVVFIDPSLRLAPEPDPEKQRADGLDAELRVMRDRLPELTLSWAHPAIAMRQVGLGNVDDYISQGLDQAERAYQALQAGRRTFPNDTIHNPRHANDLAVQTAFLRAQHKWLTRIEGATQLRLEICNLGRFTARAVRVRLNSLSGLTLYRQGGFGSFPSRGPYTTMVFAGIPVELAGRELIDTSLGLTGDGHPRMDPETGTAEFRWERIEQASRAYSMTFWATAATSLATGTHQLRSEIFCEEKGGSQTVQLDLEVRDIVQ